MFAHGHLYVALSRVSRWTDLRLWQDDDEDTQDASQATRSHQVINPVFKSILT